MKKTWLIGLVSMMSFSCSLDDGMDNEFTYELTPTVAVDIPDTLYIHQSAEILVTYQRSSTCQAFVGFDFNEDENNLYFAVINSRMIRDNCEDIEEIKEESFDFTPTRSDFYIFNFYTGTNENNENQYITKQVPVMIE